MTLLDEVKGLLGMMSLLIFNGVQNAGSTACLAALQSSFHAVRSARLAIDAMPDSSAAHSLKTNKDLPTMARAVSHGGTLRSPTPAAHLKEIRRIIATGRPIMQGHLYET